MKEFFCSNKPAGSYELTAAEVIIPIIIAILLIIIFVFTKKKITACHLADKILRHFLGTLQLVLFISDYLINWTLYGIKVYYLPLHLCSISSVLCIFLAFNRNKKIYDFVVFTGVLGGLGTLMLPNLQYSSYYLKYYQFMGAHVLIVIIPLYFLIIHNYIPELRSVLTIYIILQIMMIAAGIFNVRYNTNYMFIQFGGKDTTDAELLPTFGLPYGYFTNMEIIGTVLFFLWFAVLRSIFAWTVKR